MSITFDIYKSDGAAAGQAECSESVFGIEPRSHVMFLAVKRELANSRAGTAKVKTRAEVRGGGRKPWKQKGTGRARAGSIRSPLWVGGGVTFGPSPRDFSITLNKKIRRLAIRSALSAAKSKLRLVEGFELQSPKTREFVALLSRFSILDRKVLVLADYKSETNANLKFACRNLPRVKLSLPDNLSVRDLLDVDAILIDRAALSAIDERYRIHG